MKKDYQRALDTVAYIGHSACNNYNDVKYFSDKVKIIREALDILDILIDSKYVMRMSDCEKIKQFILEHRNEQLQG